MHVSKLQIDGNSLVGLYVVALNDIVFVAPSVTDDQRKILGEVFQVPVQELTIAGTGLLGVFMATNGRDVIVPSIIFDHEKEILSKSGVSYHIFKTVQTCLGNNVVATTTGALISPSFTGEEQKALSEMLGVPLQTAMLGEATAIGSYIVCAGERGLASYEFSDEDLDKYELVLGVKLDTGTVNLGSTQIRSGLACNKNGFIIGDQSGGPEVVHADEALGFLGDDQ